MKKIISLILTLVFLASAACAAPAIPTPAPGELLGFSLLKDLYVSGSNNVLSPMSLALTLGMAADGAEGETLAQILSALSVDSTDALTQLPEGVYSANAAFTNSDLPLKEAYEAILQDKYAAERFDLDAAALDKVNAWVKEHTNGLIESLLEEAPDADTGLLLLNAIAMDADWSKPFMPDGTAQEVFHSADGDVTVDMMRQTDLFPYAEKDGVQIIGLPYYASDLVMWIALPAADSEEGLNMQALLDTLAREGMFYLTSDAETTNVDLALPKLDVSAGNSLVEALMQLDVTAPFGAEAEFGGISDIALYISDILQKARIQIDESGTRAAAATAIAMTMMMAPGADAEPVEMRLDRPFALAIADGETGNVCFTAVIENPAN